MWSGLYALHFLVLLSSRIFLDKSVRVDLHLKVDLSFWILLLWVSSSLLPAQLTARLLRLLHGRKPHPKADSPVPVSPCLCRGRPLPASKKNPNQHSIHLILAKILKLLEKKLPLLLSLSVPSVFFWLNPIFCRQRRCLTLGSHTRWGMESPRGHQPNPKGKSVLGTNQWASSPWQLCSLLTGPKFTSSWLFSTQK